MKTFFWLFLSLLGGSILIFFLLFQGSTEKRADFSFQMGNKPRSLDPAIITSLNEGRLASALFEGLINLDPQTNEVIPGVAETWEQSDDGKTFTFHLRSDAYWVQKDHNIRPVTVDDFMYSWFRILNHDVPCDYSFQLFYIQAAEAYYRYQRMSHLLQKQPLSSGEATELERLQVDPPPTISPEDVGIKKVDSHTLQIILHSRTPYFLELLSFWTFYPVPKEAIEQFGHRWTREDSVLTNGAFYIHRHQTDYKIRFNKNPSYWNASHVALNTLDCYIFSGHQTAFNLFLTGQMDWISECPPLFMDSVKRYIESGAWDKKHITTKLSTFFIRMNTNRNPFNLPQVRKALSYSINREEWVQEVTGFYEKPAYALVPDLPQYPSQTCVDFDPDQAQRWLREAGFSPSNPFPTVTLLYNSSETYERFASVLQHYWKINLGINVELVNKPWKGYIQSRKQLDYDLCLSNWIGDYNDPMTFLDVFTSESGNNQTGWADSWFDAAIQAAKDIDSTIASWNPVAKQALDQGVFEILANLPSSEKKADFSRCYDLFISGMNAVQENATIDPPTYSDLRLYLLQLAEWYLVVVGSPLCPIFFDVSKNFVAPQVEGFYPNPQNLHPFWALSIKPVDR